MSSGNIIRDLNANNSGIFNTNNSKTQLSFESVNDLFSLQSIIELFGFNENEIFLLKIQDFLVHETNSIITNLETLNLFNLSTEDNFFSLFNNNSFFSIKDLQGSNLFELNTALIQNIETAGLKFNESMSGVGVMYPNFYDLIVDYELAITEDDGSMIDDLSTPDTKLHYPEPFIASPSFVHEDLWFIHILHYQHWLWFMFISLIMFYFITFINVVR